jgi:hypothetical protein
MVVDAAPLAALSCHDFKIANVIRSEADMKGAGALLAQ